jgi:two-component sensor histidine kinase
MLRNAASTQKQTANSSKTIREQIDLFHDRVESLRNQVQQQLSEHWDTARLQISSLVREQDKLMQNYASLKKRRPRCEPSCFLSSRRRVSAKVILFFPQSCRR